MKRWLKQGGCLVLTLLMLVGVGLYASADELEDAQARLNELKRQQEEVQERLAELQGVRDDLSTYIEQLDAEMAELDEQYLELKTRQETLAGELADTEAALAEAEAEAGEQYEAMKLRIRYVYERGDTGFFDLLFSARDLADFLNRSEYISALTDYDRDRLEVYLTALEAVETRKAELEAKQAELAQAEAELAIQQETLELTAQAKREEMAAYETQISETQNELHSYDEALAAEQANVDAIVAELKRQEEANKPAETPGTSTETPTETPGSTGGNAASNADGGWVWPAPTCRIITDGYGGSRGHKGIDIAKYGSAHGEPIVAAAPGTVVVSTYSSSAGYWIVIYHGTNSAGNDVYTCYMHCSKLQVSKGQWVNAGDQIGLIGNTGASFGAHLHFEVRLNGIGTSAPTVNPRNYVSP